LLSFEGAFVDPGPDDTHTIVWNLGDGTSIVDTLAFDHAYKAPGVYIVTLTVTDDDGGIGSDTAVIDIKYWLYLPLVPKTY